MIKWVAFRIRSGFGHRCSLIALQLSLICAAVGEFDFSSASSSFSRLSAVFAEEVGRFPTNRGSFELNGKPLSSGQY